MSGQSDGTPYTIESDGRHTHLMTEKVLENTCQEKSTLNEKSKKIDEDVSISKATACNGSTWTRVPICEQTNKPRRKSNKYRIVELSNAGTSCV